MQRSLLILGLLSGILLPGSWATRSLGTQLSSPAPRTQSPQPQSSQALLDLGLQQLHRGQLAAAERSLQQALTESANPKPTLRSQPQPVQPAAIHLALGELQQRRGQYRQALATFRLALDLAQSPALVPLQIAAHNGIGDVLASQGEYAAAEVSLEKALGLAQAVKDRRGEAIARNVMAQIAANQGDYKLALDLNQQALAGFKGVGDRRLQGQTLSELGGLYHLQGQSARATAALNEGLDIAQDLGDPFGEVLALNGLAITQETLGSNAQGLTLELMDSLRLYQRPKPPSDPISPITPLVSPPTALERLEQALQMSKAFGLREVEGLSLGNLATAYRRSGRYGDALTVVQQALAISEEMGDRPARGRALQYLGNVKLDLGQFPEAKRAFQQSLELAKSLGLRDLELLVLNSLGEAQFRQQDFASALVTHRQVLLLSRRLGNRIAEANGLNNLGAAYIGLREPLKGLEQFQKALTLSEALGDRAGQANNLNNIGFVYGGFRNYAKAVQYYQRSLLITQTFADRPGESRTLANLGNTFAAQDKPQLAILFLKEAIKIHEAIRRNLRNLPQEQQARYAETVATTYRQLADILLNQDRVLEAQQVLDRLKLQELQDYLQATRSPGEVLIEQPAERDILKKYNALQTSTIQLGQELDRLQGIATAERTSAQQKRVTELVQLQADLNQQFNQFTERDDVVALVQQLSPKILRQTVDLTQLDSLRDDLRQLQAVLLYPLVLEDRLELILTTPDAPPLRRTVHLDRAVLNKAIAAFRTDLRDPTSNPQIQAQQFYRWLIQPLEAELKQAGAKTIIYSPDAQLRYIPLSALHDGQQWLSQRYQVNNITARSLTNFTHMPQPALKILAGAFVSGQFSVKGGDRAVTFQGLPYAGLEIQGIKSLIPGTNVLIDRAFSQDATTGHLQDYNVLHMATHAAFVPGAATDSFILFGNGEKATLKDIETWTLNKIDLVVLSACETGLGGKFGPNGEEILGLGYQFQNRGARATVASLWKVDDGGTRALMDGFYGGLKSGQWSKAEALRRAQVGLLKTQFSHPYYWSAFIMIGNGL